MTIKKINYQFQFKYVLLLVLGLLSYFAVCEIAQATYQKTFTISAYYSPIPNQERYVTKSYEGDLRLNGSGVNSADGTPVYPGMIAAPSAYTFGTKMDIPGIGIVAVHDRGGAIVHAGERGQSYDRLDIWMGYGDKGLSRALNWGKRNVTATVYGVDTSIKENVYLEGFTEAEKFIKTIVSKQKIFKTDLWYGKSGDKIGKLQEYLKNLGYYKGTIDKYYGDEVYKSVIAFQIDQNIINNKEEFGAGYLGPQTRTKLEAIIDKKRKDKLPKKNLGRDDTGDEVKKLQEALIRLGYNVEITGIYDQKTIDAVFKFQQDNNILDNESSLGAGYFGSQTFAVLSNNLEALKEPVSQSLDDLSNKQASFTAFKDTLSLGDKGDEVIRLQQELKKFNLLRIEPTGYYGEITQHAVFKFQQRKGILTSIKDPGAGTFGQQTISHLNSLLGYRANNKQLIASRTENFNKNNFVATSHKQIFTEDFGPGTHSEQVALLQNSLSNLGLFSGALTTDYFGDKTLEAVIAFQLKHKIIGSKDDPKAGYVGPKTRAKLNELT